MEQSPNHVRIPNEQIQVLTTYFTALREEMVERLRLVTRTEVGKMVVVVGAIGFAIGKEVKPTDNGLEVALFFFLPLLAVLFDLYVAYHQKMLHTMGMYIRDHIERPLNTLLGEDSKFWEHYVSSSKQYLWDAAGRFVAELGTCHPALPPRPCPSRSPT